MNGGVALAGALWFGPALAAVDDAPVVGITVSPELPESATETLLSSCSSVFASRSEDGCRLDEQGQYSTSIDWKTNDSTLQVTVELASPEGERVIRVLSFTDTAPETERWQAVGLVVAALASAQLAARKAEVRPEPQPEPVAPPPAPSPSRTHFVMEISGLVRHEAAVDFLSGGGLMRGSLDVGSRWEPTVAVGMLAGTTPVNQFTVRPSFGMGFRAIDGPVVLNLRLEAMALATRWSASDPIARDSEWHVRYGACFGPTLLIPFNKSLGMHLGAAGSAVFPPVEISVRNEQVGSSSAFAGEGSLGIWARF